MRDPEKISARRAALLGDREGSFAETKYLRMSASKVRRVIDLVRGQDVNTALALLKYAPQAASVPAYKTLASAVANAEQQEGLEADDLYISAIFADEGVTLRRIRPRAKGSASRILKRGAHLTVVVEPKPGTEKPAKASAKPAAKASAKAADKTDGKPAAKDAKGAKDEVVEKTSKTAKDAKSVKDEVAEVVEDAKADTKAKAAKATKAVEDAKDEAAEVVEDAKADTKAKTARAAKATKSTESTKEA